MNGYQPNSHASNSHKSKEGVIAEKKVEKVVAGKVKQRKRNELLKIADSFLSEDVTDIKNYILTDVIIPAAKKAISDIVDTVLFGESNRKKDTTASKVSYNRMYNKQNERTNTAYSRPKNGYSFDDIVLDSRAEADEVLSRMDELVATYGVVSVADLYDLVGGTCSHTDNKYGWTDIRSAVSVRVRDGWLIKLPRALPLNLN